ncbi:MAG: phosphodiester glycosidase family protein [Clostridia bacterium]|nr:phosphodiester glycosidase family protein [Clostridia bacterium]
MRNTLLGILVLLSVMVLTLAQAEVTPIPWDLEVMNEVDEKYYIGEREYEDPSLHVVIEEGIFNDTVYLVARISIQDPTQLRSYVTGNGKQIGTYSKYATDLAKHVNAVFAISGDVANIDKNRKGTTRTGKHITRAFTTYLANATGVLDILIIDDQGDMTILPRCTEEDIAAFEGNIVSTYSFGPAIVLNGEQITDFSYRGTAYGANTKAQRICIGQTGPLEYIAVYSAGPDQRKPTDGKKCKGLTMTEFSDLVYSQGDVINAYNLDGGTSAWMVFRNERLNIYGNKGRNAIDDIIYFASAWQEE